MAFPRPPAKSVRAWKRGMNVRSRTSGQVTLTRALTMRREGGNERGEDGRGGGRREALDSEPNSCHMSEAGAMTRCLDPDPTTKQTTPA